jgi:predicted PurR-regulated permease PerM
MDNTSPNNFTTKIFLLFFIIIILINGFLFQGLFHALAFAAILSGSFYPLYTKINKKIKRKELASLITTIILITCIIVPISYIAISLSKESLQLYRDLGEEFSRKEIHDFLLGDGLAAKVVDFLSVNLNIDIDLLVLKQKVLSLAQTATSQIVTLANTWVSHAIGFLFQFLMMIVACFALFIEGEKLKKFVFKLSPLPDDQEQMILDKFSQMNYVTLVCNGVGGLIQGLLAGIGLYFCGIESIVLWTTLMIILAFIPLLGISIITIPASFYLILTGHKTAGIIFLIYSSTMSLYIENIFKPKFIGKRIQINSILLLFYIIAGMGSFGMAGIFYGPILCILFLTMVDLFTTHYLPKLEAK